MQFKTRCRIISGQVVCGETWQTPVWFHLAPRRMCALTSYISWCDRPRNCGLISVMFFPQACSSHLTVIGHQTNSKSIQRHNRLCSSKLSKSLKTRCAWGTVQYFSRLWRPDNWRQCGGQVRAYRARLYSGFGATDGAVNWTGAGE